MGWRISCFVVDEYRYRVKNPMLKVDSPQPPVPRQEGATPSGREPFWGNEGLDFGDLIDIVNPLQHIPVVSRLYREATGDDISDGARLVGGGLFGLLTGGVTGVAGAVANAVSRRETGQDLADHALQAVADAVDATPPAGTAERAATPASGPPGAQVADAADWDPFAGDWWEEDAATAGTRLASRFDPAPPPAGTELAQTATPSSSASAALADVAAWDPLHGDWWEDEPATDSTAVARVDPAPAAAELTQNAAATPVAHQRWPSADTSARPPTATPPGLSAASAYQANAPMAPVEQAREDDHTLWFERHWQA